MKDRENSQMSLDVLKQDFFKKGSDFFGWNLGKNTPNILSQLTEGVQILNKNIKAASDSSTKLAEALNRITWWAVLISAVGLVIAAASVAVQIIEIIK